MILKRNVGLDFIKVIACCSVVALHTLKAEKSGMNFAIIAFAAVAIPLFLLVNGYLMFTKEKTSVSYVMKKVGRILLVCFAWEALHGMVYLLYYHEARNFVVSFVLDFFQKGLFFHFWFMGTLIILYLLLPLLRHLYEYATSLYIGILIGLGTLCVILDIAMIIMNNRFILNIPQSLRLWYWLFYYMLGGLLSKKKNQIGDWLNHFSKKTKIVVLLSSILVLIVWQGLVGCVVLGQYVLESFYGCIPVMLAVTIVFLYITQIGEFKHGKVITYLSSLSMGVYIFHPFILAVLNKFIPAFLNGNSVMNLLFWILTIIISGIVAAIVNAIPIAKELIKI